MSNGQIHERFKALERRVDTLEEARAQNEAPADGLTTCNCRWRGAEQVQQCSLHSAHIEAIRDWAERAKTAERLRAQVAPAGWKLVPVELTPEMESECMGKLMDGSLIYERGDGMQVVETVAPAVLWAKMLAATPAAPAQQANSAEFGGIKPDAAPSLTVGDQASALTDGFIRQSANMTWATGPDDRDRVTLSEPEFGRAVRRVLTAMGGALARQAEGDETRLAAWIEVACQSGHWLPDAYGMPKAQPAAQAEPDNLTLRRLLASRVAGATLYTDDGELSDSSAHPAIDFKRDTPAEIEAKLMERGMAQAWKSIGEFASKPAAQGIGLTDEQIDELVKQHAGYGGDDIRAVVRAALAQAPAADQPPPKPPTADSI